MLPEQLKLNVNPNFKKRFCTKPWSKVTVALLARAEQILAHVSQEHPGSTQGTREILLLWSASQETSEVQTPAEATPAAETWTTSSSSTCLRFHDTLRGAGGIRRLNSDSNFDSFAPLSNMA